MNPGTPEEVRAAIAAHMLGDAVGCQVIGTVTLHRHQIEAATRLRAIIRAHGGALLADEVGLGKTFTALAVAGEDGAIVVAPAALRAMWRGAAERARVQIRFVSMELLGHGGTVPSTELLIVDEAHHFRNAKTRRYRQLAEACARCPVLLLSATPVQNSLTDLRSLLALIVGTRAHSLTLDQLGELIVRRAASTAAVRLPVMTEPVAITVENDADCLEQLCALPPPLPACDGGHAHALLLLTLLRQWASSQAALTSALTRRLAMSRAMEDALSSGRHPTKHELALWRFAGDAQQLAFPELALGATASAADMLPQLREHADALRGLLAWLRNRRDIDAMRAEQLAAIAKRHRGERIVAFAEYTETPTALYRHLSPLPRVALLTHAGGRVAGGPVSRAELLRQFGARAVVADHERVDLLLTTDLLSEGVDLQAASVVVHLDLTWNPARMEQRVGRLRRIGAPRDTISVYLFAPPAPAERLLQLDRRLRAKLRDAARSVGLAGAVLPGVSMAAESSVGSRERMLAEIGRWSSAAPARASPAAAIRWPAAGALACLRCGGEVRLVAILHDKVEPNPSLDLLGAIARQEEAPCDAQELERARARLIGWMEHQALTQAVGLATTDVARSRRAILDRVNGIAARIRRHQRQELARMLGAARNAATVTMPAGAEAVLGQLSRAPLPDDAWLRAVGEFGAIHARAARDEPDAILALLLLVPER